MLNLAITLICALFFLLSGSLIQCLKRILYIIIALFLKFLSLLGIKINKFEGRVKISKEFKQAFPDIRIVKKSKQNLKTKPSINILFLILLIISLSLIIINLNIVSGNIVSKWIYSIYIADTQLVSLLFISSQKDMDIVFTAVVFSILSFSSSKLLSQWKETAKFRQAKKEMKLKQKAINLMTSKELLDAARDKDSTHYKALKKED